MISLLGEGKLNTLLEVLNNAPHVGAIAEVGVFKGGALKAMAKARPTVPCFGFDTFEGLPAEYDGDDEHHRPGEFASRFDEVKEYIKECPNVTLVKGVFPASAGEVCGAFAFVHLDMDQWRGTRDALNFFYPRMVRGGIILFDDFGWDHCAGIEPVVTEFTTCFGLSIQRVGKYQAYVVMP